jgi:hypothetical protein
MRLRVCMCVYFTGPYTTVCVFVCVCAQARRAELLREVSAYVTRILSVMGLVDVPIDR